MRWPFRRRTGADDTPPEVTPGPAESAAGPAYPVPGPAAPPRRAWQVLPPLTPVAGRPVALLDGGLPHVSGTRSLLHRPSETPSETPAGRVVGLAGTLPALDVAFAAETLPPPAPRWFTAVERPSASGAPSTEESPSGQSAAGPSRGPSLLHATDEYVGEPREPAVPYRAPAWLRALSDAPMTDPLLGAAPAAASSPAPPSFLSGLAQGRATAGGAVTGGPIGRAATGQPPAPPRTVVPRGRRPHSRVGLGAPLSAGDDGTGGASGGGRARRGAATDHAEADPDPARATGTSRPVPPVGAGAATPPPDQVTGRTPARPSLLDGVPRPGTSATPPARAPGRSPSGEPSQGRASLPHPPGRAPERPDTSGAHLTGSPTDGPGPGSATPGSAAPGGTDHSGTAHDSPHLGSPAHGLPSPPTTVAVPDGGTSGATAASTGAPGGRTPADRASADRASADRASGASAAGTPARTATGTGPAGAGTGGHDRVAGLRHPASRDERHTAPYDLTRDVSPGLGSVPVHRGPDIDRRAVRLGADAWTEGGTVHLPAGAGAVDGPEARALIAHELVHVAQQQHLGTALPDESSPAGEALEAQALAVEAAVRAGAPLPRLVHPVPSTVRGDAPVIGAVGSGATSSGATDGGTGRFPVWQPVTGVFGGAGGGVPPEKVAPARVQRRATVLSHPRPAPAAAAAPSAPAAAPAAAPAPATTPPATTPAATPAATTGAPAGDGPRNFSEFGTMMASSAGGFVFDAWGMDDPTASAGGAGGRGGGPGRRSGGGSAGGHAQDYDQAYADRLQAVNDARIDRGELPLDALPHDEEERLQQRLGGGAGQQAAQPIRSWAEFERAAVNDYVSDVGAPFGLDTAALMAAAHPAVDADGDARGTGSGTEGPAGSAGSTTAAGPAGAAGEERPTAESGRPAIDTDDLDLDEIATKLYDRIRSRLRLELLLDRERAGLLSDFR